MKSFATKEKRTLPAVRKARPCVHHPKGSAQQARQAEIRRILRATDFQVKLIIGRPDDKYEQEADRVADRVVDMARTHDNHDGTGGDHTRAAAAGQPAWFQSPGVQNKLIRREAQKDDDDEPNQNGNIQREINEDHEESDEPEPIQREAVDDEEEKVQEKASRQHHSSAAVSQIASRAIKNKGSGALMRPDVRGLLETGMTQDLGGVRVHESTADRENANRIGARAFTYRNHIWLGKGESQSDLHLMAHESTHVLQQGGVARRKPSDISRISSRIQGEWLSDPWQSVKNLGGKVVSAGESLVSKAGEAVGGAKDWILSKVAGLAEDIPGFHLLTVILGKNPITQKPVERNAVNLIHGVMGLIPGGHALFENLQKTGAFERAYKWFKQEIKLLNLTWTNIRAQFKQAWDSLSGADLLSPQKAFNRIKSIFLPPIVRIKNFALAAGRKVLQFIFEGALRLAGSAGEQVLSVLRRAKAVFWLIFRDPIKFLGNLLKAVGQGFTQFSANIWKHLKTGLFGWLFGTLSKAGIQLPAKFGLKGIVSLVLQILGLTYANLRVKLVKLIGEKPVSFLEKTFAFLKVLVTEGIVGAWKMILQFMGSLKEMVIGAIQEWVVTKIVTSAVTKLATMFNPVGAIIQAVITIYNTVMFFIERAKQIMALAKAVFDSVTNIALGKLKAAANYVEQTMARTIPVIISFLARLLGLGGIADKIKDVIKKIQAKVNKAVDKIIGFIVKQAKKLFGKGIKTKKESEKEKGNLDDLNAAPVTLPRSKTEEKAHLDAAARAVNTISKDSKVKSNKDLEAYFPKIKRRYRLKEIGFERAGTGLLELHMAINPKIKLKIHERMEGTGLDGIKTDVKWETANLSGVMIGKRMRADWLGPDHPQGTPPGSGVQKSLMDQLITDPDQPAESKYIRGHLLNDNVGGEGKDYNLYPITGDANKKHYDSIERKVKHWVNNEKYWVTYHVVVDEKGTDLSHGIKDPRNFVNAVFKCRAAIMGTDGKEYDTVTSDITSTFKAPAEADVKETESAAKPSVSQTAKAMEPKLSTSKSSRIYVFNGALHDAMASQSHKVSAAVISVKGLGSVAWSSLQRFFALTGGNKDKDLGAVLPTAADKRMFTVIMANAHKILKNI